VLLMLVSPDFEATTGTVDDIGAGFRARSGLVTVYPLPFSYPGGH